MRRPVLYRKLCRTMLAAGLLLAIMPSQALALKVTQSTLMPNNPDVSSVIAISPTRLTYVAKTDPGETVEKMELDFPKGTDLKSMTLDAVALKGLTRIAQKVETKVEGEKVTVTFDPAVKPDTTVRLQVWAINFPNKTQTFRVTGSYTVSGGGAKALPKSDPVTVNGLSTTEALVARLDRSPFVEKWNSVTFLGMFFKPQLIVTSIPQLFRGWLLSLFLVGIGFPLAIPIGLILAFLKMSKIPPIRGISALYINVIRGTPLFLQIFIAFFGLPLIGIRGNDIAKGILVLALNSSAYLAEIFRAGIQSISRGQFEAASSLGMTYAQSMRYVIIPQTVKRVLPTMTSEFILLYKDTALLAAVGIFELMMYSKNLVAVVSNITPYVVAAVYYLIVTTPLIRYVQTLEERLAVSEGGHEPPKKRERKWFWQRSDAPEPVATLEEI